jgi:hypothetical protein
MQQDSLFACANARDRSGHLTTFEEIHSSSSLRRSLIAHFQGQVGLILQGRQPVGRGYGGVGMASS